VAFSGIVKTKKEIQGVVFALGFSALYISLFAILQKVTNGWLVPEDYWLRGEGPRVTSFYSYPNAIGLFVAPIVMLHLGYFYYLVSNFKSLTFRSNKLIIGNWAWDVGSWWRILQVVFSLAVVISGVLAIWFARSDGAIIGLVAGLIVFGLFFKKTRIAVFVLLFFCFLVILFSGLPAGLEQKLTFADWSGQARLSMWSETWQMLGDHWLLGVGLAGYQTALAPYHQAKYLEIFLFPHNFILNFWVELGLGGLLAFLYLIGKFFYSGFKIRDPRFKIYVAGLIAVMVVTLVHGLVDVPYFKNDLAILWWVWFGLMSALRLS